MNTAEPRPIGELFSQLADQTGLLVRQEVALAKTEMSHKVERAVPNVAMAAAGMVMLGVGGVALLAAVILALATVVAPWLSALIVAFLLVGGGLTLSIFGVHQLRRTDLVPHKTIQSLKENKGWLSEQMR